MVARAAHAIQLDCIHQKNDRTKAHVGPSILSPSSVTTVCRTHSSDSKMRGNAVSLFVALFARYPEYQRMFRAFKDVPLEELPRNGVVKAHALAVFYFITVIIESMDDNDLLVRRRSHLLP
ncbi:hypothetical protein V5799_008851 [Amblyomma americanum]|uniref:Globin domain-containing protein n=1 Tax=Amblyomma americanum TaxID=6943 RepID=A0AAQ4FDK0_AMBAM